MKDKSGVNPYEGMTVEEILAAMPPWKADAERIRKLGLECPKTATEAQALLKRMDAAQVGEAEVGGMGLNRRREVLTEAECRLIEDERRWAEAAKHNRGWIKEVQAMGEYQAARKRMHMEAEYWAKSQPLTKGNYDPIKLFVNEIRREIDND
jgi:septal ring factor EnvC (AmiA/AmiB activator)